MGRECEKCGGTILPGHGHDVACPDATCSACGVPDPLNAVHPPDCTWAAEAKKVDHPDHYKAGGMEAIDVIEALGHGHGFCVGNAIKYLWRAGRKSPNALEDLKKARWYVHRAIAALEGKG